MPGTTRQIFDQLQGSNGIVSRTPGKVDSVKSSWDSVNTQWNALKTLAGSNGILYFNSKGLTDAYMATVTTDSATKTTIVTTKATAQQSQKEFSPRMMTCDSYTSARERLQDTDLGAQVYDRMFAIHATSFLAYYDTVIAKCDAAILAGNSLGDALRAHPIPPVVPPATVPVVDPAVNAATNAYKAATDAIKTANATMKSQSDTINAADTGVMLEYLKYISNANLAKVLPEWYDNPDKTNTINTMSSQALIDLIK